MRIVNRIALALVIIGALVWGIYGIFNFNLVAWIFNGSLDFLARIVYVLVGIAGIWCISLLFYPMEAEEERHHKYENFNTESI